MTNDEGEMKKQSRPVYHRESRGERCRKSGTKGKTVWVVSDRTSQETGPGPSDAQKLELQREGRYKDTDWEEQ